MVQLSHPYTTTRKTLALTLQTFVGKVVSLLFNVVSRVVVAFLPRNKHLLISWLQSSFSVILVPKKIKSVTVSIVSPSICHEVMGPNAMIFVFWMLSFKPAFSLSSFTFNRKLFSSSSLSAYPLQYSWASLVAQLVKNPPAMQETWVQSLGWEDPLEKKKATHFSILAWRIPWTIPMGSQRVGYTWVTFTSLQFLVNV